MLKSLTNAAGGITLAVLLVGPSLAAAQEAVLDDLYGSAVHQYFAGNYSAAIADLDAAIDGGRRDPRAYYFRGLAKQRAGYGGEEDFQTGAAMEAADTDQFYPVGKSLERIQGSTRMTIERYRSQARAMALAAQRRSDRARYQQLREREPAVLRAPAGGATAPAAATEPAPAIAKPGPAPAVPEPPAAADPFADDSPEKPADVAPTAAGAPAAPATTEPAIAEPGAAPAADPGTPPPPVAQPPVAQPPAAEMPADDDPFGEPPAKSDAPAADDEPAAEPKAEAPKEEAPKEEMPAEPEKPAAEDDPFATP